MKYESTEGDPLALVVSGADTVVAAHRACNCLS